MKPTGFGRKIDVLGRVVIPVEVRRQLGIEASVGLEILVNGNVDGLERYRGKWLCRQCVGLPGSHLRRDV